LDSDVVLESGNVLESDSSPYFEDSDSDLDSYPEDSDSDSAPEDLDSDSDSNPGLGLGLTQHCYDTVMCFFMPYRHIEQSVCSYCTLLSCVILVIFWELCDSSCSALLPCLEFWAQQSANLHRLHEVAMKALAVPATSAPVERAFSSGGMFMRPHRARLSNKMLSDLVFLKCNIHKL